MLRGGSPPWIGYACLGSLFLAPGSAVIGLGAVGASGGLPLVGLLAVCGGVYLGVIVHFCGWFLLGRAMRALREEKGRGPSRDERRMRWSLLASLLAFGVGIVTLPSLLSVSVWGGPSQGRDSLSRGSSRTSPPCSRPSSSRTSRSSDPGPGRSGVRARPS